MLVGRIKPLDDLATSQRLGRSGPEPVADLIEHPLVVNGFGCTVGLPARFRRIHTR